MHLVFKKKQEQKIKRKPSKMAEKKKSPLQRIIVQKSGLFQFNPSYTKFARIFSFAVSLQSL